MIVWSHYIRRFVSTSTFHNRINRLLPPTPLLISSSSLLSSGTQTQLQQEQQLQKKRITQTCSVLLTPKIQSLLKNGTTLISTSTDIVENLAIEEWLYKHHDFSIHNEMILLVWRNTPAVVIGRHQNIWTEAVVEHCRREAVCLVRRNSGGGTVYHDMENLNISFLTSRSRYDRKRNLQFISDILWQSFRIRTAISSREDLVIADTGEKISGTASKLNSHNSYHHCTLLVDVDRHRLHDTLRRVPIGTATATTTTGDNMVLSIKSNATKSVPSPVVNLRELVPTLTIDQLIDELAKNFGDNITRHGIMSSDTDTAIDQPLPPNIHHIDCGIFPQIDLIIEQYRSWNWTFGRTPKFSLQTKFNVKHNYISSSFCLVLTMKLFIDKGLIEKIELFSHSSATGDDDNDDVEAIADIDDDMQFEFNTIQKLLNDTLVGTRFEQHDVMQSLHKCKHQFTDLISSSPRNRKPNIVIETCAFDKICLAIFNCLQCCLYQQ